MARQTAFFGGLFITGLIAGSLFIGGCEVDNTPVSGKSAQIRVFTNALALVDQAADDFDGAVGSESGNQCPTRTYSCGATPGLTESYSDCANVEGTLRTGRTYMSFDNTTTCGQHRAGTDYTNGSLLTRTFDGFVKADSDGTLSILSAGGYMRAEFLADSGNGEAGARMTILNVYRSVVGNFSYSYNTPFNGPVYSGRKSSQTRVIQSGTIKIVESVESIAGNLSFSNVSWPSASCSYPQLGSLTMLYTAGKIGTERLRFTTDCGVAEFTDVDGAKTSMSLGGALD